MTARLKFTLIAGFVGLVIGSVAGWALKEKGGSFPAYLPIAFTAIFALCGFCSKKEWAEAVFDFFTSILGQ